MNRTHVLIGAVAVLVLVLVFMFGRMSGGTTVNVNDCAPVESFGWTFKGC